MPLGMARSRVKLVDQEGIGQIPHLQPLYRTQANTSCSLQLNLDAIILGYNLIIPAPVMAHGSFYFLRSGLETSSDSTDNPCVGGSKTPSNRPPSEVFDTSQLGLTSVPAHSCLLALPCSSPLAFCQVGAQPCLFCHTGKVSTAQAGRSLTPYLSRQF